MSLINDNSDLLILSEEDTKNDGFLVDSTFDDDFDLNFGSDDNKTIENNTTLIVEPSLSSDNKLNIVDDFDFSNLNSEVIESVTTVPNIEMDNGLNNQLSNTITSLDNDITTEKSFIENKNEEDIGIVPLKITSVGTMVDILDRAMNEMTSRTDIIVSDIADEEDNIEELKSQISSLNSYVIIGEKKVSDLVKEKNMISKNVKSLEKMKLSDITTDAQK